MPGRPPQNLEELRQLYIDLSKNKGGKGISPRALAVLKRMLDESNESAAKSISEIANENGISTSSVTRLAQKLGFDGFPGLKNLFRQNLNRRKSFYSAQVRRFLQKGSADDDAKSSVLQQAIQDEWSNVMLMADAFDEPRFAAITDLLIKSEEIHVIGLRGSYPLAYYLCFYLKMIRGQVNLIGQAGHTLAEDLSMMNPGGLLIAIGVHPYTRETVEACRMARAQRVNIVAVTDSVSSPLADETENYLIVSTKGDYFFSPIVAAMICLEALLSEVVKKLGDKAIQRLNKTEYVLDKLSVEI